MNSQSQFGVTYNTSREFVNESVNISKIDNQVAEFPVVSQVTLRRSALNSNDSESVFLDQRQTLSQKVSAAWYNHGLIGALSEVSNDDNEENDYGRSVAKSACYYLLIALRWLNGMQLTLFPHLKLSNEELINDFSPNNNWTESPIRLLAWHSKACKFALAHRDDTVHIHYCDNALVPMLKHKLQRNISCMEWKPLAGCTLAVGTQTAVLIWNIDPASLSTRPSTGAVQVLLYAGHSPVSSIAWSPLDDDILFTCSALSSAIVVWNVSLQHHQVLQHVSASGGVARLLFSPEGSKLLAMTPSSTFRVFETATWSNERWSNLAGRVQSACWNPAGTTLLFALVGDLRIYSLTFTDSYLLDSPVVEGSKHASIAVDLTDSESQEQAGSNADCSRGIHQMVWDETGERVAVLFKKSDPNHSTVMVFDVANEPSFSIAESVGGLISKEDDSPSFISFKPNFSDGASLTVCYASGLVQYYLMPFKANLKNLNRQKDMSVTSPMQSYTSMHNTTTHLLKESRQIWSSPDQRAVYAT